MGTLAWALHLPRMTSLVVGASNRQRIQENLQMLSNLHFAREELDEINRVAPA
jgi:aryl-alcohol dehydrogenase-like predicted oxidoreductase